MTTMTETRSATHELAKAGQSPWLDSISRQLIESGELKALIDDHGLLGVTSNPTIFDKAISTPGGGYEKDVRKMLRKGAGTLETYDYLTISDIQAACDLFRNVHKESNGEHGFVSLEVTPDLAHDEKRTLEEARRLFKAVNRPNVMIKVPATPEGLVAFRELTAEGINVNVTLIFSLKHYLDVANAYLEGLEKRRKKGADLSRVHSVASVFVSRFDTLIDGSLQQLIERETVADERRDARKLKGKAGVANARLIYREFQRIMASPEWKKLEAAGATIQKVLWGSTSVKNPDYSDLLYVENLVGRETVNTMPAGTLDALIDHGQIRPGTVEEHLEEAQETVERLRGWGIDLIEIGEKLQHDGLISFMKSFDSLMRTLEVLSEPRRTKKLAQAKIKYRIPAELRREVPVTEMKRKNVIKRFFEKDPTLWKSSEEDKKVILNRLGWLDIPEEILGRLYELDELARQARAGGVRSVVLLGMGGSSLAPEVMNLIGEAKPRSPKFYVLDTTDPASILAVEEKLNLAKTLFVVASKSGSTVETLSQFRYFYNKVSKFYGRRKDAVRQAGNHFIAVTDEGSRLEQEGYEKHFRKIFINPSDIGGRYSALSFFGMVPAALTGLAVRQLLRTARELLAEARKESDPSKNTCFYPGVLLGALANHGTDKLTFWSTRKLASFGAWLEQLVAESTGKEGRGIIPVDGDAPADPKFYGPDRVFLVLRLKGEKDDALDKRVRAVKKAGYPVIEMDWTAPENLAAEFLRWEIITAVASSVMQVNPFDEPNVKESKDNTSRLLAEAEERGRVRDPEDVYPVGRRMPLEEFFQAVPAGGYVSLLGYIPRNPATARLFKKLQTRLRNQTGVPALAGFGPRYLHSIGQLYKGGPAKGAFVIFVIKDAHNAKIPETHFSFSELKKAQAIGDMQALGDREVPLLVVDLGRDAEAGLKAFDAKLADYFKKAR